jgi:hypothetical protein
MSLLHEVLTWEMCWTLTLGDRVSSLPRIKSVCLTCPSGQRRWTSTSQQVIHTGSLR